MKLLKDKALVIAIAAVISLAGIGTFAYLVNKQVAPLKEEDNTSQNNNVAINDDGQQLSNGKCSGTQKPKITNLPMNNNDFSMILPYGLVIGAHVTPIDHQYFSPKDFKSDRYAYPVYAMADATLVDIGTRNTPKGDEYRMVFSMSCKLFYYYDLVTKLTPEIQNQRQADKNTVEIPIKAGQQIGWIGGQTLDFAVWDMDVELTGFVNLNQYKGENWKIHTADPLLYYTDELKEKILAKYIRTQDPISGKIDYDIKGKLVGNWFLEGSGGYIPTNGNHESYWKGHLSIAPDYIDPTSYVFSIGDYQGEAKQFGIKADLVKPEVVGVDTGIIKYELVQQDWANPNTGAIWNRTSFIKGLVAKNNQNRVYATVLIQMLEDQKVKIEIFHGKTAKQVNDFGTTSRVYTR